MERRCPSYLLPSVSIMGRCIPQLDDQRLGKRVKIMKNEDGNTLDITNLIAGVKFIKKSIEIVPQFYVSFHYPQSKDQAKHKINKDLGRICFYVAN